MDVSKMLDSILESSSINVPLHTIMQITISLDYEL